MPDFNIYEGLTGDIFDLLNLSFDTPGSPSVVLGNLSQSVAFVGSVHDGWQFGDGSQTLHVRYGGTGFGGRIAGGR